MNTPRLNRPNTDRLTDPAHTTRNGKCYRECGEWGERGECGARGDKDKRAVRREEKTRTLYTAPFFPEIESAIERAVPTNPKQPWWMWVFSLARELKSVEALTNVDPIDLADIVTACHQRINPAMIDKCSVDGALSEFLGAWARVEFLTGDGPFDIALAQMKVTKIPDAAKRFSDPTTRSLVHLCWALQEAAGDRAFFLSSDTAAREVGCQPMQAWRLLKLIEAFRIIQVVEKGKRRRATRYKFIGSGPP